MTESPTPSPPPPNKTNGLPDPQWFCYFVIAFTGYLFVSKPASTTGQIIFRLGLMLGGVVGLLIIRFRKKKT
ncbi:MAG: hypothetical protein ACI8W8_004308 [Rhodothermales bacterium]|jgi:hypothetical protein